MSKAVDEAYEQVQAYLNTMRVVGKHPTRVLLYPKQIKLLEQGCHIHKQANGKRLFEGLPVEAA